MEPDNLIRFNEGKVQSLGMTRGQYMDKTLGRAYQGNSYLVFLSRLYCALNYFMGGIFSSGGVNGRSMTEALIQGCS